MAATVYCPSLHSNVINLVFDIVVAKSYSQHIVWTLQLVTLCEIVHYLKPATTLVRKSGQKYTFFYEMLDY